ncbi:MAG: DUF86 domain-containing protein [Thermoguttaceae bacterium]|nr:DUF86 domain-containing protein [Thermoguttaceae bacterium]
MNNDDQQALQKIYNHLDLVILYSGDCKSLDDFQSKSMTTDACVFNLMQIGELAKMKLSKEVKMQTKAIPWEKIIGLRNRIAHDYSGVDMCKIWDVIQNDLTPLKKELEKFL